MSLRLGIDTGGTYTDAVIINEQNQVLVAVKSLTTRHNLAIGIGESIGKVAHELLADIEMVSLSTTLTTNAVVEGNGAPVCALVVGLSETQVTKSGLGEIIDDNLIIRLAGGHDASGRQVAPLDVASATAAILAHKDKVSAFSVSAQFGVRNPSHEIQLQNLVTELTQMPVTCGHELATSLGAPRRALTASLNARMIPFIQDLIQAVQNILQQLNIKAPLMIVKGDGSIVNAETALVHPVTTILSGPAASVIGACALSGSRNAIIADMGGTTTDIAIVTDGQPELANEGARVGDWQPMVETVKVYSIGLGGDSEVRFYGGSIALGPRRVVPMSLLAQQHPQVLERMQAHLDDTPTARHNRFVTRLEHNQALINQLTPIENQAWEMLEHGPVEMETLVFKDQELAKAMARLERKGMAIYSGFTPSDAAHVLGNSNHWSIAGAKLAAQIWARQMRFLYGLGSWEKGNSEEPAHRVFTLMNDAICQTLLEAGLHQENLLNEARSRNLAALMSKLILKNGNKDDDNALFGITFGKSHPIVAVGAPATTYYPQVAKSLDVDLILPKYGHVANAVGAVMGSVVQRSEIVITQPTEGIFRIFHGAAPFDCHDLDVALSQAEAIVKQQAYDLAKSAGAADVDIRIRHDNKHIMSELDGELFVEAKISAIATGKPTLELSVTD
ncbi:MAG: N-methylhydantoinase A/oxoprolinase/acetone carboxylase beta subunit [Parasphingorhabdus sp.]|jgi:N-methylhydantoinase A/oxoprolinase/acetone carboxylase beta subunit|tara:strand:- start:6972 stop:8993 length:2022 start_codon:yes stop_codon:yes gene_type:complete